MFFKKLLIASAAVGALAFPATAGAAPKDETQAPEVCAGQAFEQAFAQFNDKSQYTLVPNGSFEDGLEGWEVSGNASVVDHANVFRPEPGSHALLMEAGSSVTSPAICVSKGYPYARLFAQQLSAGGGSGINVEVLYPSRTRGGNKPEVPNSNAGGNGNGGGRPTAGATVKPAGLLRGDTAFGPSRRFSIGQGRAGHGTAMVRFRFSVKGSASYLLDDVLVDPRCRR